MWSHSGKRFRWTALSLAFIHQAVSRKVTHVLMESEITQRLNLKQQFSFSFNSNRKWGSFLFLMNRYELVGYPTYLSEGLIPSAFLCPFNFKDTNWSHMSSTIRHLWAWTSRDIVLFHLLPNSLKYSPVVVFRVWWNLSSWGRELLFFVPLQQQSFKSSVPVKFRFLSFLGH